MYLKFLCSLVMIFLMFFLVRVFLLWVWLVVRICRFLRCLFLIRVWVRVVLLLMMLMKLYIMWCL